MEKCLQTCFENNFVVQPCSVQGQSLAGSCLIMVRRAKAKAKAVARVREEQGTEPEIEPAPIVIPMRKQKPQPTLPEPEMEDCTAAVDIRIPGVRSISEKKKSIGFAIFIAIKAKSIPLPKKPRMYKKENWDLLARLLDGNQLVGMQDFGSKQQCDLSNGLATMITDLSWLLEDTEGDLSMYANILDIGIMIGPLAEHLYELHCASCD